MWAGASRSSWIPGVPNMELLDLNVCPDGFQFRLYPLLLSISIYLPLKMEIFTLRYSMLEIHNLFLTLTGLESEFALSLGGDIELDL